MVYFIKSGAVNHCTDTLYRASARMYGPYVKINCGGIPASLVDSELFDHEQGAFTDAISTVKGRFGQTHQGVLRLDGMDELPPLALTGGKISGPGGAAELLQLHPNTLRAKMAKLGVDL